MTVEQILAEATKLPTASRAFVAEKLLETLDYEEAVELSAEWVTEIRKRTLRMDAEQVQMLQAEKVFASIVEKLRV